MSNLIDLNSVIILVGEKLEEAQGTLCRECKGYREGFRADGSRWAACTLAFCALCLMSDEDLNNIERVLEDDAKCTHIDGYHPEHVPDTRQDMMFWLESVREERKEHNYLQRN